jgi:ribosome-associated translation inhibitor RaiA
MSFFDSPIVQEEIENISKLGSVISENVLIFPTLSLREKSERVETLQEMLDKINLFYARLSLSEDKEAQELKQKIQDCSGLFGEDTIQDAFNSIQYLIDEMRKEIDRQ